MHFHVRIPFKPKAAFAMARGPRFSFNPQRAALNARNYGGFRGLGEMGWLAPARRVNSSPRSWGGTSLIMGNITGAKRNRLGGLADTINSPGMPGSSTFFLYGIGDNGYDSSAPLQTDYDPAIEAAGAAVAAQSSGPSFWESLASGIKTVATAAAPAIPALLAIKNQNAIAKANLQRVQSGLPAFTPYQMQQLTSGAPAVNVGLTPGTIQAGAFGLGGIALIAAGIGAVILLSRKR